MPMITSSFIVWSLLIIGVPLGGSQVPASLEGLWAYTGLAPRGQQEVPLTGLFVFHQGLFLQQAINDGLPFDQQGGQAHCGTYRPRDGAFDMTAEVAVGVSPGRPAPLSLRRNTEHQITPTFSGDALTLTFGSGTVQKFRRVGPGDGRVVRLKDGMLALVDGHFLLVAAVNDQQVVAGSGTFEQRGQELLLEADRWFSVKGTQVSYLRETPSKAQFDGNVLILADGTRLQTAP